MEQQDQEAKLFKKIQFWRKKKNDQSILSFSKHSTFTAISGEDSGKRKRMCFYSGQTPNRHRDQQQKHERNMAEITPWEDN